MFLFQGFDLPACRPPIEVKFRVNYSVRNNNNRLESKAYQYHFSHAGIIQEWRNKVQRNCTPATSVKVIQYVGYPLTMWQFRTSSTDVYKVFFFNR